MKAMILSAGRGQRMRPLTNKTPKALLTIKNKPLIEYHLESLQRAGIKEVIINLAHLGDQIKQHLGNGEKFNLTITYSQEPETALETGGGIYNALPLLGKQPFIVINADVFTDYPYENLSNKLQGLAHLVLVNNPDHNPNGDFALQNNHVTIEGNNKLTFAGIGIYHPNLFQSCQAGTFPLAPLLKQAIQNKQVTAEHYQGTWTDVGTPERLEKLNL